MKKKIRKLPNHCTHLQTVKTLHALQNTLKEPVDTQRNPVYYMRDGILERIDGK